MNKYKENYHSIHLLNHFFLCKFDVYLRIRPFKLQNISLKSPHLSNLPSKQPIYLKWRSATSLIISRVVPLSKINV